MQELTLVLIRFAYLAILWVFVLGAISVIRSDMFGARADTAPSTGRREKRAAAKQSKQVQVPEIMGIAKFAEVLSPEAIVLNQDGASGGLADRVVGRRAATLLIGPEPGFSDAELRLAGERGVAVATFGPVVLRTETAALAALAALSALRGDF